MKINVLETRVIGFDIENGLYDSPKEMYTFVEHLLKMGGREVKKF